MSWRLRDTELMSVSQDVGGFTMKMDPGPILGTEQTVQIMRDVKGNTPTPVGAT
jgi:hypothetical protein